MINKNQNNINININNLSIDIINQILSELRPVNQLLLRSSSGGPGNGRLLVISFILHRPKRKMRQSKTYVYIL